MSKELSMKERIERSLRGERNKAPGFVEGTSLYQIENSVNGKLNQNNTSGVTGVYLKKKTNQWKASIKFQGKYINLGTFAEKGEAIAARKEAEEILFKPLLEKYGAKKSLTAGKQSQ